MSQVDTHRIQELIKRYKAGARDLSEANVAEGFVAPLFAALGWETTDPLVWNRQSYVRGAGYADVALQIQDCPVLFIEIKRFGRVTRPQEEVVLPQALFGEEPILSQAEREERGIDRTPEEKQAMRYARGAGIRWAVLTNFERLILFDANEERVVLAFDSPEEYLARAGELAHLAPADTPEQFNSHLQWYANLQKKPEIDESFYRFLSQWRLRLAQVIYEHNRDPGSPLCMPDGRVDLDLLRQAVQRTLDRLVILRYADDVGFLDQHDLLESQLVAFLNRRVYAVEYEFQQDLNRLYAAFYRRHDTALFAPGHICERVRIPNNELAELVQAVSGISFRKFSSDILGNTYESYLGQRLVLEGETIRAESDRALRRGSGIYYTPSYIVRYIVDHTLGRWLYGTVNGRPDGEPIPGATRKTLADLKGLRVLDPAMGSGSFLIYAFDVLADFYERENERIRQENTARWEEWGRRAIQEGMFSEENNVPQVETPAPDYVRRILQEHLYGVDLDPEAVEIAGVNLILRAFDRLRGGQDRKLPPLLGQNLKVGNSLISGVTGPDDLAPFEEERRRLIVLRRELAALEEDAARTKKTDEIAAVAEPINAALNESLVAYFEDPASKRPFNWEVEFPEVFDPDLAEEERGFTIVVGNPPYIFGERIRVDEKSFFGNRYSVAKGQYDLYWLFYERCVSLTKQHGFHGYIVPDALTVRDEVSLVRKMLLDQGVLDRIAPVGPVFSDPEVSAVVTIWRKSPEHHHLVEIDYLYKGGLTRMSRVDQQLFTERPGYRFAIFISPALRSIFARMEESSSPLIDYVNISRGEELGKRDLHSMALLPSGDYVPILVGENVTRFGYPRPTYAIERERIQKPRSIYEPTKILVVKTGHEVVATLDDEGYCTLQSLYNLVPLHTSPDLRFLLAIMLSKPIRVYFRKTFTEYKGIFPQINQSQLSQIPIPSINLADPVDVTAHDALVALAQRMLDLNRVRRTVTEAFAEAIRACERTPTSLRRFLNEHRDFIALHPLLDANEEGEVNGVAVEEQEERLLIRARIEDVWRDVVQIDTHDEDLRLYLLLALRAFLEKNRRKRVWSRGKIQGGLLSMLEVPRLSAATPEAHLRRVAQLLTDVRRLLPDALPHHNLGLDRRGAPLHLDAIEEDLAATDAEIDRRVYDLYGLTEEERRIVEETL